jgi:hypothetical protein
VKYFAIGNHHNFNGDYLPADLFSLTVRKCRNYIGKHFPSNLRKLHIIECDNFKKDNVPLGLTKCLLSF